MPAFTMPGLGSGQNTNEIVAKLVELEKKPVKRWEKENNYNEFQIKAWKDLKRLSEELENKTKDIISIATPLAIKKVYTEDGSVTGEAGKLAKQSTRQIEVEELATKHQILGNKVKRDIVLPAGEFTLKSKEIEALIHFSGGDLKDLAEIIRKKANLVANLSLVNIDSDFVVYSMTSVHSGKTGELKIIDNNGILALAGLVGKNDNNREFTVITPQLNWGGIQIANNNNLYNIIAANKPTKEGETIITPPGSCHLLPINAISLDKDSFIKLTLPSKETSKNKIEKEDSLPEKTIYMGVEYETPSGKRTIFREVKGKRNFRLYLNDIKKNQLTGIILGNNSTETIKWQSLKLIELGDLKGAKPLNTVVEAKDAKFKIDGVEVIRDKNEALSDVLEGMSITLNKKTEEGETQHKAVQLKVQIDMEKGIELIKNFVKAHNELVQYIKDITVMERTNGPESKATASDNNDRSADISSNYWEKKTKTGLLAGDNSLLRLVAGINRVVAAAYPANDDPKYRVLADIGISSGALNEKWSDIKAKKGLLIINEIQLKESIEKSPDSVKELFASDTNYDSRMDNGVGVKLIEHLKPFNQFSTGIVESKIRMLETLIAENQKKIKGYDSHIASYEKKLKTKFMYMEQGVGKNKAVGSYLRNNLTGAKGE